MYANFFKRVIDFTLSLIALIVLSPILLILIIIGAIAMKGNPFFTQMRPGKVNKKTGQEKIFKLIKFRTMSNAKDKDGNLLPDEVRLNKYGKLLRSTSLDELPITTSIPFFSFAASQNCSANSLASILKFSTITFTPFSRIIFVFLLYHHLQKNSISNRKKTA